MLIVYHFLTDLPGDAPPVVRLIRNWLSEEVYAQIHGMEAHQELLTTAGDYEITVDVSIVTYLSTCKLVPNHSVSRASSVPA